MVWHNIFEFLDYDFQVHYRYLCKTVNEIAPKCRCKSFINTDNNSAEVIEYDADNFDKEPLRVFYGLHLPHDWSTFYVTNSCICSYDSCNELISVKWATKKGTYKRYVDPYNQDILKIDAANGMYKFTKYFKKQDPYASESFIRMNSPYDVLIIDCNHHSDNATIAMYIDYDNDTVNFMCLIAKDGIYYYIK